MACPRARWPKRSRRHLSASEVGQILEGQISFPLVVRYPRDKPTDLSAIEQTLLDTPSDAQVPLAAVADIREDRGPNFITREGVQRKIVVQCNVAGRDLRGVVNDIQRECRDHSRPAARLPGRVWRAIRK